MGEVRIGVYVCHCGLNIAATVDVKRVAEETSRLPNVVVSRDYVFMCSTPGQDLIKEDIRKYGLNRIVVAACSPTMHESTFRAALEEAGLNKYLLEMANIREHCSWVHRDRAEATRKAIDLVRMAVEKARYLEPVEDIILEANRNILVVGGGIAGLRAAIEAARAGFKAYIIEKSPVLGGRSARVGWLSDGRRGRDIIGKLIGAVGDEDRIRVYTNARLIDLSGYPGNFKARVRIEPRYVDAKCNLCGKCVDVCPVEVDNEYEFGLVRRKAIYYPFKGAYPPYYVIDPAACTKCGKCIDVCPVNAINLDGDVEEVELDVGAVILAIGADEYIPPKGEFGYGYSNRVITLFQLERLLDDTGPTKGILEVDGVRPRKIVFILCVGSRSITPSSMKYCSRMCCTSSLVNAIRIRDKHPDTDIYILYQEIMTYGEYEYIYEEAGSRGIKFLKFIDPPEVNVRSNELEVILYEATIQEYVKIRPDLIVLATGLIPRRDLSELTEVIRGCEGPDGFLREAHLKLAPVDAPMKGIYIAGAATGPRNMAESASMGSASASKAVSLVSSGRIVIEPLLAEVDEDKCSGCAICVSICPFEALSVREVDGDTVAHVEKALCMGCGSCAAACPSGAIQHIGFTDRQIIAQIHSSFGGVEDE